MDVSAIRTISAATQRTGRLRVDSILMRDPGIWPGMRMEHWRFAPREIKEQYIASHMVLLHLRECPCETNWDRKGWKDSPLQPYTIHILPAGMPHAVRWTKINEVLCVSIEPERVASLIQGTAGERKVLGPVIIVDPSMAHTILALADDIRGGCTGGPAYGEALSAALVARLCCVYGKPVATPQPKVLSAYDLRRVLAYVDANIDRAMAIEELAKLVSMDQFQFSRVFKNSVGSPPYHFVLQKRIELAKKLLGHTALNLSEIALSAGFSSHSHFANAFRNGTGYSPRSYRKLVRP